LIHQRHAVGCSRGERGLLPAAQGVSLATLRHLASHVKLLGIKSVADMWQGIVFDGGRTRARTLDPLIKSQLLYQLSYAPIEIARGLPRETRRLAKPPGRVQPETRAARNSPRAGKSI
jgi:hypothetical protein